MSRRGDNIYKRKDGRWEGRYVKYKKNGRTIFGAVFAKTYREARKKLARARYEWNEGIRTTKKDHCKLGAVCDEWLKDSGAFLKESTIAIYRGYLERYILPAFGKTNMSDITNDILSDFCICLMENGGADGQGLSPKTVSEIFRVMKQLRKFAALRGIAVGYTVEYMHFRQKATQLRVFSQLEQKKLHEYLDGSKKRSHIGILLCLATGLRLGELCALTWRDISLYEKKLYVRHTLQRVRNNEEDGNRTRVVVMPPKSESSIRTIPLTDEICSVIAPFWQPGTYFLTGDATKFMESRTMQNHFKAVLRATGIEDANFHALRHTFATRCVEAGVDIKCLSELLGHSTVHVTLDRYVHPTLSLKRQNMEKLVSLGL